MDPDIFFFLSVLFLLPARPDRSYGSAKVKKKNQRTASACQSERKKKNSFLVCVSIRLKNKDRVDRG
jgi:hypothetical protein